MSRATNCFTVKPTWLNINWNIIYRQKNSLRKLTLQIQRFFNKSLKMSNSAWKPICANQSQLRFWKSLKKSPSKKSLSMTNWDFHWLKISTSGTVESVISHFQISRSWSITCGRFTNKNVSNVTYVTNHLEKEKPPPIICWGIINNEQWYCNI